MKFSAKNFFSMCQQIHQKLRIYSHLLKKSLAENLFCTVPYVVRSRFNWTLNETIMLSFSRNFLKYPKETWENAL